MGSSHLNLSPNLFVKVFPFHFVFNKNREIVQVGEVLERISPEPLVGTLLDKHFYLNRPKIPFDFNTIHKKSQVLFILKFVHNRMQFKGQMIYQQDQDVIFFLGYPWITDTSSLASLGLT
jgi:hypothetical protein